MIFADQSIIEYFLERLVVVEFDATTSDPHGSINHRVLPKVRIEETGATNVYPRRALQGYCSMSVINPSIKSKWERLT